MNTIDGTNGDNLLRLAKNLIEAHETTSLPPDEHDKLIMFREIEMVSTATSPPRRKI